MQFCLQVGQKVFAGRTCECGGVVVFGLVALWLASTTTSLWAVVFDVWAFFFSSLFFIHPLFSAPDALCTTVYVALRVQKFS